MMLENLFTRRFFLGVDLLAWTNLLSRRIFLSAIFIGITQLPDLICPDYKQLLIEHRSN